MLSQAEMVARGLTSTFIHNFDALVTKHYLGSRFNELEVRVEAELDKRLAKLETDINGYREEYMYLECDSESGVIEPDVLI